jgi:hypothetical protein
VVIIIKIPGLGLSKVNTGEPPKLTSSFDRTPSRIGSPVLEAVVVSSYTLFLPTNPVIVRVVCVIVNSAVTKLTCIVTICCCRWCNGIRIYIFTSGS